MDLKKTYMTHERGSSFIEAVKSMFVRKTVLVEALKSISFDVEEGEMLGFLGPNGAGKSTTLKILTGVLYPTSGEADILGYNPWRQRKNICGQNRSSFRAKVATYMGHTAY